MNTTTITIDFTVKHMLEKLKRAKRETYNEVLARVLPGNSDQRFKDELESWKLTAEILSEPETMARLAESLDDLKHGRLVDFDDF